MIKVSIFDACPIFVHGLTAVLGAHGFKVTEASDSPRDYLWLTDVFVLDPPALRDTTVAEFVAEVAAAAPVVVLAENTDQDSTGEFLRAGAAGVVDRCAPVNVVIEALRTVAGGHRFVGDCGPADTTHRPDDESGELSPRELQVITQIARGLTHAQVARVLGISRHTVDTYVKRVRFKLQLGNKAELTRAAVLRDLSRQTGTCYAGLSGRR
jgi:DNA-binding NarL/FixJ family response regulator